MRVFTSMLSIALLLLASCGESLENTTLWKIEGNNLEAASYLFGTIHIGCDLVLEPKVKRAMDSTSILVTEIHPDELWGEEMDYQEEFVSLPNGNTLHDYMNAEEYNMLRDYLMAYNGLDIDDYQTNHPMHFSVYYMPPELNCAYYDSFEALLTDYAYDNDKEFGSLETLEFQRTLTMNTPVEEHIEYLLKEARSGKPANSDALRMMIIHYNNQDLNGLGRIILSDKYTKSWRMNEVLLDERNHNWLPKIDSIASMQPTFFAVGAAHLIGEQGLINLLEEQGFVITPVF